MRIALAVDGTRGDVFPMLGLGERLRGAGHSVVICGPPDAQAASEARGFELRPMGIDVRQFLTREAKDVAGGKLRFVVAGQRYFEKTVRRQFERLPSATSDVDFIFGAGLCFAGPSAAQLHGIPYRFVAYCPLLLPSAEHAPFMIPTTATKPRLNRLLWRFAVPLFGVLLGREINRRRTDLALPAIRLRDLYTHFLSERPILATAAALAPVPADCPLPVQQVPCLHRIESEPLPSKLESFLDAGPRPVYLGFGSMTDPTPEATTAIVLEAVAAAGCRAILSEGWARLGDGPLPTHVLQVGTVSHDLLFPRCAVVVHHGGAGTTTTAARAGIPQIVVPHGADQYHWGALVQRLGLGPPALPRYGLRAEDLATVITATLENEGLSERAAELRSRIREDDDAPLDIEQLLAGSD